jgi:CheY-like chemotaxis protein
MMRSNTDMQAGAPETILARRSGFPVREEWMNRPVVLVVDDDAPTRAAYAALLTDCGFDVLEARHGGEAILQVHRHRPEVVLMDLVMPVLDGARTAEALRERALTAQTRILGVTAASNKERDQMRLHCDDLIEKPCSADAIVDRIRALVEDRR